MRSQISSYVRPLAAYLIAAVLATMIWLDASPVIAGNAPPAVQLPPVPHQNPFFQPSPPKTPHPDWLRPRPSPRLGSADELATLRAIHTALSSVGDGGAYIWQRGNGLIDGLIRPTTSFKSSDGRICRHIIVRLNSIRYSREVEGIACRDDTGGWSLSG